MGKLPSQIEEIPSADFDLLVSYWQEEPWGPTRDNKHAAMICREIRRSTLLAGARIPPLDDWMLVLREERQQQDRKGFFDFFRQLAGGNRVKAEKRPKQKKVRL